MNVDDTRKDWHGEIPERGNIVIDRKDRRKPLVTDHLDDPWLISKVGRECIGFLKYAHQLALPICILDKNMQVTIYNLQFSKFLAVKDQGLKYKTFISLLVEKGFVFSKDLSNTLIQNFNDKTNKTFIVNGKSGCCKITTTALNNDTGHGDNDLLLLALQEVQVMASGKSAYQENLMLRQENKELKNFSYLLAHDLKSPLRIIKAFADLLSDEINSGSDEVGRIVEIIGQKTAQAKSLVDDLLSLFKLKSRQLIYEEVDLNKLIEEFLTEAPKGSRATSVDIPRALPKVIGVKTLLNQLMINLLSNAFKFTSNNTNPNIQIEWEKHENEFLFTITDNGIGLDMKYKDKIFDPFFRLYVDENHKGNGLGLSMVKKIIEEHNGKVWVEAELTQYTRFYFTIPEIVK